MSRSQRYWFVMLEVTTLSARLSALCWSSCIVEDCERIAYSIVLGYHCVLQSFCRARFEAHDSEPVTSTSLQFNSCFKTFWNTDLSEARTCQDRRESTLPMFGKANFTEIPMRMCLCCIRWIVICLQKCCPQACHYPRGAKKDPQGSAAE